MQLQQVGRHQKSSLPGGYGRRRKAQEPCEESAKEACRRIGERCAAAMPVLRENNGSQDRQEIGQEILRLPRLSQVPWDDKDRIGSQALDSAGGGQSAK